MKSKNWSRAKFRATKHNTGKVFCLLPTDSPFRGAGLMSLPLPTNGLSVLTQWKQELDANITLPNGNGIPVVLLGNKVLIHIDVSPG